MNGKNKQSDFIAGFNNCGYVCNTLSYLGIFGRTCQIIQLIAHVTEYITGNANNTQVNINIFIYSLSLFGIPEFTKKENASTGSRNSIDTPYGNNESVDTQSLILIEPAVILNIFVKQNSATAILNA